MELNTLPTEVILSHSHSTLGYLQLDWNPQPGSCVEVKGQPYLILERRHRYLLVSGKYQLQKIALYVQKFDVPEEGSWVEGRWVIGDITCQYNARSEVLRCAVNPSGPCEQCMHYQPISLRE
ncbi:MAG: DUF6464 family protein [Leptolyngbyaceae cyanobacterium bins.59]|nr:DUF6464 family protein [Leptolyngbyaceae cyanobacterium bins.59]